MKNIQRLMMLVAAVSVSFRRWSSVGAGMRRGAFESAEHG